MSVLVHGKVFGHLLPKTIRRFSNSVSQEHLQTESLKLLRGFSTSEETWLTRNHPGDAVVRLVNALEEFSMPDRVEKISAVAAKRIASVSVICEGTGQLANIHAVARGMDCFGYHSLNVIGPMRPLRPPKSNDRGVSNHRVGVGSTSWVNIKEWPDVTSCARHCKQLGFQVVATALTPDSVSMDDVDFTVPTAVMFGNEVCGLSKEALECADKIVSIPMRGMTTSLNISNAAIVLNYHILMHRMAKFGSDYRDVSPEAENWLKLFFHTRSLGNEMARARLLQCLKEEKLEDAYSYESEEFLGPRY